MSGRTTGIGTTAIGTAVMEATVIEATTETVTANMSMSLEANMDMNSENTIGDPSTATVATAATALTVSGPAGASGTTSAPGPGASGPAHATSAAHAAGTTATATTTTAITATLTVPDLPAILRAAESVPDPELPVVTLGDLGIVRGVATAEDGALEIAITPTYVGCPATEAIARDVREAVAAMSGGHEVRTRTVLTPAWSTDWISAAGRRKLAEHGIAPPTGTRAARGGPVAVELSVRCPRCDSHDTRLISRFGSTPCQSLRACRSCGEPFGAVKPL